MTEDEMVGWHHRLNGHEFEQTPGGSEGQGSTSKNKNRNQPQIFIGRTNAEAEVPILWPPDVKSQLIGKDPDAGKIEGRRRRG